ncbi:type II secretion system protein N [Vibrio sp. SS-MA-C1-2]|uniref:type II secretion system protein N n=1 Tax=Vibrio sp. SS-MA-C1-2 TaxID=2908646 RepID=UPI001F404852|nr:type II secretion system protein N [Vibrio sp. SS-MA-C1-2]UJF19451.1 type II secretion system protein N [Vibrio sp. SS-MA-C1-2]
MKKCRWLIIIVVLLSFIISLVVHLPAQWVIKQLPLPHTVRLQEVSGTLWQGSVKRLMIQGVPQGSISLGQLDWQLSFTSLLTGNVEADVRFGRGSSLGLDGRGKIAVNYQQQLTVENLLFSLPASSLIGLSPMPLPVSVTGRVDGVINQWQMSKPLCSTLKGGLSWQQGSVATPLGELPLDTVQGELGCQNSSVTLETTQVSKAVASELSLSLSPKMGYQLSGWLEPKGGLASSLRSQLKWLGQPDSKGRYRLKYQGRL